MVATVANATTTLGGSILVGNSTSVTRMRADLNGAVPLTTAASFTTAACIFGKGASQPLAATTANTNAGMPNPNRKTLCQFRSLWLHLVL